MAEKFFDVQAALLFDAAPQIDFNAYLELFKSWSTDHGLAGPFEILRGTSNESTLTIAGAGLHATIHRQNGPCKAQEFALPLRAPILKQKKFDFKAAIRGHQDAIVINVGDGETLLPIDVRETMAQTGVARPSDPMLKLTVLHLLMQSMAIVCRPTMVSFCPSQSLLSPQELAAVSNMALPIPILFHPLPVSNGKGAGGQLSVGMAAIHAPRIIGAELELENIPVEMPTATRINLLATLISNKHAGTLALDHGDSLQPDGQYQLSVRHKKASKPGEPLRIIASFQDAASGAKTPSQQMGHQAFQDRIARLKPRERNDITSDPFPSAAPAACDKETNEDLRARVQETITPAGQHSGRGGIFSGPIKLVSIVAFAGLFAALGPTKDLTELATAQVISINALIQTLDKDTLVATGTPDVTTTNIVGEIANSLPGGGTP